MLYQSLNVGDFHSINRTHKIKNHGQENFLSILLYCILITTLPLSAEIKVKKCKLQKLTTGSVFITKTTRAGQVRKSAFAD